MKEAVEQDFKDLLRRRPAHPSPKALAAAKRRLERAGKKAKAPTIKAALENIAGQLTELLKNAALEPGPLKFVVTKRDWDGEVKEFRVES